MKVLVESNNYRLCTITKIDHEEVSEKEGLCIDKLSSFSENNYYVIMDIAWDNVHGCCEITSVDTRILDIADAEWQIVKPMIKVAHDILELANKVIE